MSESFLAQCIGKEKALQYKKWVKPERKNMLRIAKEWFPGNACFIDYLEADLKSSLAYYDSGFSPIVESDVAKELVFLREANRLLDDMKLWLSEEHELNGEKLPDFSEYCDRTDEDGAVVFKAGAPKIENGVCTWKDASGAEHSFDLNEYYKCVDAAVRRFFSYIGEHYMDWGD
jgi:hypothetical protein